MIFQAMPTADARAFRAGRPDANGQPPERHVATGMANPCRHCLRMIPEGAPMLILAYRPFPDAQPYAETGPVFLCAGDCARHPDTEDLPPVLTTSPDYLVKGYSQDHRIVYGTGAVVPTPDMAARIGAILDDPRVAYVHIRSARNNCYQARAVRASA
ncbi:MAG: DUF1203 domain-containing protein [Rhodobacteraceae bacterium]|nr:MAG: DUF1203 domain-containing protein [Paracoccaceae bacterium]